MSFFGRLFGSTKSVDNLVEHAASGLDKMFYTKEERADDDADTRREALAAKKFSFQIFMEQLKATQGQNLSRRIIAQSVNFIFLAQIVSSQVFSLMAVFADRTPAAVASPAGTTATGLSSAEMYLAASEILWSGVGVMAGIEMVIIAFYFGSPYIDKVMTAVQGFRKPTKPA